MAGDKKITQLQALTTPAGRDYLLIVDRPTTNNSTAVNKNISLDLLFGNIPSNTTINAKLTVTGNTSLGGNTVINDSRVNGQLEVNKFKVSSNGIIITNSMTPANSNPTGVSVGKIFWDSNYIYVKTANNIVKRVALSSF